jgi:hypothetical protein
VENNWKNNSLQLIGFVSVFIFLSLFWALIITANPFFEKLKIEKEYSDADLLKFTQINFKTNASPQHTKNDTLAVVFPYTRARVDDEY